MNTTPIDLQRLSCHSIQAAAREARGGHAQMAKNVCARIQSSGIGQFAIVPNTANTNETWVRYTDPRGFQGVLRFAQRGTIYDGFVNTQPIIQPDAKSSTDLSADLLWIAVRGTATTDPLIHNAAHYVSCLQTEGTPCTTQRNIVRGIAEHAARQSIATIDARANAQWAYFDRFFAEAKRRDDNDSDLDVLIEIYRRHAQARHTSPSSTLHEAQARLEVAQRCYKAFTESKHFDAFIFDEGDCTTRVVHRERKRCPNRCPSIFDRRSDYYSIVRKETTCTLGAVAKASHQSSSTNQMDDCSCKTKSQRSRRRSLRAR